MTVAPASAQEASAVGRVRDPADPLEPLNRGLYGVHRGLDKVLIRPLMLIYTGVTPGLLRAGLRNAVGNLGEPITFVNDVLTVRPRRASRTVTRFATNSTIGVFGLFDFAKDAGFPRHTSDFGQTLARYGVGPGPYLFIPGLGPSTLRDTTGRVFDGMADPVLFFRYKGDTALRIARPVVSGLELRSLFDSDIQALDTTATDPYVTLRSAYLQNRQSFIQDGQVDVDALPSFTPEAAEPAPQPGPSPEHLLQELPMTVPARASRHLVGAVACALVAVAVPVTALMAAATPAVAQARRDAAAEQFVQINATRVLQVLNDRAMPVAQKRRTFETLVDQVTDVPKITDFVLGKYNRTITPAQKREFAALFRDFANNVYESRLGEYGGERLVVTGSTIRSPGDVVVASRVQGGQLKQPSVVNWRVLKGADGRWKAVDVQVQGVWLAITQQQDFVSTIDNAGGNVNVLLAQLRNQVAQQRR